MDLEHCQIIRRFLGDDSQTRFTLGPFPGVGAMLVTEDRGNGLEIQPGSGAIDQPLKDGFQIATTLEQEVPAVLDLIDRKRVLAMDPLLFGHIQRQTEALGEPMPQDLLQAPYRAALRKVSATRFRSAALSQSVKQLPSLAKRIACRVA